MYIQYKDDIGKYYIVDLGENIHSFFLLTFNWLVNYKVYSIKKHYTNTKIQKRIKINNRLIFILPAVGAIFTNLIKKLNDTLFVIDYFHTVILFSSMYISLFVIFILILKVSNVRLKKELKQTKYQVIQTKMIPNSKFCIIISVILFCVLFECIKLVIHDLQIFSIYILFVSIGIIGLLIFIPCIILLFTTPKIEGRILKRVQ